MATLCIYFAREAVHDFGSSCDECDAVAIFGEQASRNCSMPQFKIKLKSGEQSYAVAAPVPEPFPNPVENISVWCIVIETWQSSHTSNY